MQVAEKKLGCMKGIARANIPCIGYIEGSVNNASMPNGGKKQVSFVDKKVTLWAVKDFDVTVLPEDVTGCSVAGVGLDFHRTAVATEKNANGRNKKANEYGHVLNLTFADGTSGTLQIIEFYAFNDETILRPDLNPLIKVVTDKDWKVWESFLVDKNYYPVVAGWLDADGKRDEHYDDLLCPEDYRPDIVELRKKAQTSNKINALANMANALTLKSVLSDICKALDLHTRFDGFEVATGNNDRIYAIIKNSHIYINKEIRNYIRLEKK